MNSPPRTTQFLSSLLLLLLFPTISSDPLSFSFDFPSLSLRNLTLLGDAHLRNGSVGLTSESGVPSSTSGSLLYNLPIPFLLPRSNLSASFSTKFSFSITNPSPTPASSGDGLTFFLSPDNSTIGAPGRFLGLFSPATNSPAVAVEFDTRMNPELADPDANHVGLDVGWPESVASSGLFPFGVELKSGNVITAWIEYDAGEERLSVWAGYSSLKPKKPVLSTRFDLSKHFKEWMYAGFSASTEGSTEVHTIESWSFRAFGLPAAVPLNASEDSWTLIPARPVSFSGEHSHKKLNLVLIVVAPAAFSIAFMVFVIMLIRKRTVAEEAKPEFLQGLREFQYQELSLATKGFHKSRIVGTGAFGLVYQAIYPRTGTTYAVKRSKQRHQSRTEFAAELSIIASLRHRNLVQLQGWCTEKGELLLVYEFMPNGSLDKVLYNGVLDWPQRCGIALDIASVLTYLHEECEQQVIHRDIKTSNIMLDEHFNARLGDFGLARLLEHNKSPLSTLTAGTMGYLSPEYLQYGKATDKSDVYSYGVVLLEVCCGRRPIDVEESNAHRLINLVDWVWSLHLEDRLIEAADQRLSGEFGEEEMKRVLLLGLGCVNPICGDRPSMRRVLQILNGEAAAVVVPKVKPCLVFACSAPLVLQEIVSDCFEDEACRKITSQVK